MVCHDNEYLKMIQYVLDHGVWKENRTSDKTKSIFGYQMRFDLRDGSIPLLTTKKMHLRSIIHELLWYLMGDTNTRYLEDNGVTIWREWQDENGYLGPGIYGNMWRHYPNPIGDPIDQIADLVHKLKTNPNDRRMLVNAWNPGLIPVTGLPPCHYSFQCHVANGELSMILNQRSCDVGLGVPFNIVQYSLLLRMLAHVTGLKLGEFIWNGGDVHIYEQHIAGLQEQLDREPFESPKFEFARPIDDIDSFKFEDFVVIDYKSHDKIDMRVSV